MNKQFGQFQPERPKGLYVPPDMADAEGHGQGAQLNAGLIATAAALFVIVGTGAYTFMSGSLPSFGGGTGGDTAPAKEFVSRVQFECDKGWMSGQNNTDQMHCYMVKSTHRLCDPQEKKHFLATLDRFEADWGVYSAKVFVSSMQAAGKVNLNAAEIGMASAKMSDPRLSEAQRLKEMQKLEETMAKAMEGTTKVMTAKINTYPYYKLEQDFTKLVEKGLLAESDFGWSKPRWVEKGFKNAKTVKNVCKG